MRAGLGDIVAAMHLSTSGLVCIAVRDSTTRVQQRPKSSGRMSAMVL